jgi:hypothetical protein
MLDNLVLIGIGGSGAKIVESVVHLAAVGDAPINIYPILIDQDLHNGNIQRTREVIKRYKLIQDSIEGIDSKWVFKSNLTKIDDKLLPLVPEEPNNSFNAAIGYPGMSAIEQKVVQSLFCSPQREEILDKGYKKRANMGSALFHNLIQKEELKGETEPGLKMIVNSLKSVSKPHIVIAGSLFGGTGASGITNIGKYFRSKISGANVTGLMMLPYFTVSNEYRDNDPDAGLVRSDSDMQLVKVALDIYREEMESSFHNIMLIGSQTDKIQNEDATIKSESGGEKQLNPAHIFELIAATAALRDIPAGDETTYYQYSVDSNEPIPDYSFQDLPSDVNASRFEILRAFSNTILSAHTHKKSWKKRQPWLPTSSEEFNKLYNWATRFDEWIREMSQNGYAGHVWRKFNHKDVIIDGEYQFGSKLSMNLDVDKSLTITDVLKSVNKLSVKA